MPAGQRNVEKHFFGYKDHVVICRKTKFVRDYEVSSSNVHDSRMAKRLAEKSDGHGASMWMDAGYVGADQDVLSAGMVPIICEKGYRGHPLTDEQKASNRSKSKVRCLVEHTFGFMEQSMHGLVFRGVGIVRAKANIAMTNLVYNMCRLLQIKTYHPEFIMCK